ncbi:MAG: hypothetical protein K0R11_1910 [Acidimicrobiales bacterium]|nr:hypothetical protein [Acidimicrobiales bacterium]
MRLVVFGADVLVERGVAEVEWRAVEHDPAIPSPSEPVSGDLAAMLDREVSEVRGLVLPRERFPIARPPVHPNSGGAVSAFAAASSSEADALRARLFAALWFEGRDIGEPAVVGALGGESGLTGGDRVSRWREEWLGLDRRLVPMLLLPGGHVSRGLGALTRLAELAT